MQLQSLSTKKNTRCRYCNSKNLTKFLSLGNQPLSNSFIKINQIKLERGYPLDVYFCQSCYLVQLIDVVSPKIIFDKYLYHSSSSKALKNHYKELAQLLTNRFNLQAGDVVVDIGCNDGILLHGYSLSGLVRVGVEPSQVAKIAINSGLEVIQSFFGVKSAQKIIKKHGTAKVVTATNVFAHVDEIEKFAEALPTVLGNDGVFIIEVPYLIDLIDQTLFDTIYHEHLCYLSLTPMVQFLNKFGLEVFEAARVAFGASGPAIRVFVQIKSGQQPLHNSVAKILKYEKKWGIGNIKRYYGYAEKVEKVKADVLKYIKKIQKSKARLGGYGAPAKGNTLLNYFGITSKLVECIAETDTFKQELLTPGSHIPIVSEKEFLERMPEYALLLSWNYLDFFLKNSEYIKRGGKFLVPLPKPQIVP